MSVRTRAVSITDARPGATLSTDQRTRRYLWTMAFRVLAFIGAALTPLPWNLALIAAAVLLPAIAVLFGNARDNHIEAVARDDQSPPAITSGPIIPGEVDDGNGGTT